MKIYISVKTEERIDWEEKNLHWKPLPRELNYSPFQCPQLAMIEKIFGQWGSFLPGNKRNRGERNMFTKVGNEIRIGFDIFINASIIYENVDLLRN